MKISKGKLKYVFDTVNFLNHIGVTDIETLIYGITSN